MENMDCTETCPLCGHESVTVGIHDFECDYCHSIWVSLDDDVRDHEVITDNTDRIPYECIDPALR